VQDAVGADPALALGVNVWDGEVTCLGVAESLGLAFRPLAELLA
jgi:alanine dehydrogenase